MIQNYANEADGAKIACSKDKYKATLHVPTKMEGVDFKVRVLKVAEDKNCVEFSRTGGDQLEFFETFNTIREFFGGINNAAF